MSVELKRINRKLEHQGKMVSIYTDSIQMPDGSVAKWDYVEHRMGAAAVVPVLEDGRILLVQQYRTALDRLTLELPAGARDSETEDSMVCAARELEEETGYCAGSLTKLLSLKTTVAFCNEGIEVYLATDLKLGVQKLDEQEFIELVSYTVEELCQMIAQGVIQDAKTVAGILAYASQIK